MKNIVFASLMVFVGLIFIGVQIGEVAHWLAIIAGRSP